ncbi:MAG: thioesterase family protein [Armatimonadota bacterium]|nr:thioesterase family protein [Armatimonadota bacterium]MDR5696429.1 thioesterase family protein [Armatimonadota bacterium]
MRAGLVPGTSAEVHIVVTEAMVANFDELGMVHPVYSTWTMVKHLEEASRKLLLPFLEEDEDAVGHAVEVVHLAPTPVGMRVRARAVLERVEGRRVYCRLEAFNERGKIGDGRNVQVVVPRERLTQTFREIGAIP